MNYVLFFITVPSFYPVCCSRWVSVSLMTVSELTLEVVGPRKTMCTSLLSEDLHFKTRLGDPRHMGTTWEKQCDTRSHSLRRSPV